MLALLISMAGTLAAEPDPQILSPRAIEGEWRTVRHGARVQITDCGDGSPCGYLVSVDQSVSGGQDRDIHNPDPDLRTRPLSGLPILWGYSGEGSQWRRGHLYNPETGQTFRSSLQLMPDGRLKVKGCLGVLCRTQHWVSINPIQPEERAQ